MIRKVESGLYESICDLPTWKTIKLGIYKSIPELREALEKNGFKVGEWAGDILSKVTLSREQKEVELMTATTAELGFKDGAYYRNIDRRIKKIGDICPAEVGPQLRLQYSEQPKREALFIAMDSIMDSDGCLTRSSVVHDDDGLCLGGSYGYSGSFWYADNRWVFLRRK